MLEPSLTAYKKNEDRGLNWMTGAYKKTRREYNMFDHSINIFGEESALRGKPVAKRHSVGKSIALIGS